MDPTYLLSLAEDTHWLPGHERIFNAFSIPLSRTRYILMGESPYPRAQSANGYAFWDARVHEIWSPTGLSREVNRATSLRNFIKMLLYAEGLLHPPFSQRKIASLDLTSKVQTLDLLFQNLLSQGFLLLNASLVLSTRPKNREACAWCPFIASLLRELACKNPSLQVLLFGKMAQSVECPQAFCRLEAEHPYNISFITNPKVVDFFAPLHLLQNTDVR